jgi:hypothetical protein
MNELSAAELTVRNDWPNEMKVTRVRQRDCSGQLRGDIGMLITPRQARGRAAANFFQDYVDYLRQIGFHPQTAILILDIAERQMRAKGI